MWHSENSKPLKQSTTNVYAAEWLFEGILVQLSLLLETCYRCLQGCACGLWLKGATMGRKSLPMKSKTMDDVGKSGCINPNDNLTPKEASFNCFHRHYSFRGWFHTR